MSDEFIAPLMPSWHSYPSIYHVGHRAIRDLLNHPVYIEEKVDGSQFSFGIDADGELRVRSKGAMMYIDAPEKMFTKAVETVKSLRDALHPGWTYRGEFLAKPKHNTLAYNRAPNGHIIIFDINTGHEEYLTYSDKAVEAYRLGLEVAPLIYDGMVDLAAFRGFLDRESILGGQKIEGVVIKPKAYNVWGEDKKVLLGKFVSEAFKESHSKAWKESNPAKNDVILLLAGEYTTPARWNKAIQHLRERGEIEDSPRDIGEADQGNPERRPRRLRGRDQEQAVEVGLAAHCPQANGRVPGVVQGATSQKTIRGQR